MSRADTALDAVAFLRRIAGELAAIHRGSDYSLWRGEAKHRVDQYLSGAEPFHVWSISKPSQRSRALIPAALTT